MIDMEKIRVIYFLGLVEYIKMRIALTLQRKLVLFFVMVPVLMALTLVSVYAYYGISLDAKAWRLMIMGFLFPVFFIAAPTLISYYSSLESLKPITYEFSDLGIQASTENIEFTHKWSAIIRIDRAFGFLMFFFNKSCAHFIPLRALTNETEINAIVQIAIKNGARIK